MGIYIWESLLCTRMWMCLCICVHTCIDTRGWHQVPSHLLSLYLFSPYLDHLYVWECGGLLFLQRPGLSDSAGAGVTNGSELSVISVVLGTKLRLSEKAMCTLNHWEISTAQITIFFWDWISHWTWNSILLNCLGS